MDGRIQHEHPYQSQIGLGLQRRVDRVPRRTLHHCRRFLVRFDIPTSQVMAGMQVYDEQSRRQKNCIATELTHHPEATNCNFCRASIQHSCRYMECFEVLLKSSRFFRSQFFFREH